MTLEDGKMELDLKILNALQDQEDDNIQKISITEGTFAKIKAYAKVVTRIAGGGMECYGYLIKEKGSLEDTITDAYLADNQEANSGYCRVTEEGILESAAIINERGYELVGWWHSHGTLPVFHSGTDVRNFENVLHAIAPTTMKKRKEAVFNRNGTTINVDNYKIEGVPEGTELRILKDIERDPYAISIVVNERGENYREIISKTFNPATNEFDLHAPRRMPPLEVVQKENDVTFDLPDMEWEVRQKVRMSGARRGRRRKRHNCPEYVAVIGSFFDNAITYINDRGKFGVLLANIVRNDQSTNRFNLIRDAEEGNRRVRTLQMQKQKEELCGIVLEQFTGSPYEALEDPSKRYELENRIVFDMLNGIGRKTTREEQDRIIETAIDRAKTLTECTSVAEEAIKGLNRYFLEIITDYKEERTHNYGTLIGNMIYELVSGKTLVEAAEIASAKKQARITLQEHRVNAFNQITKDLYRIVQEEKLGEKDQALYDFVKEFPEAYKNGSADQVIEKYLIPLRPKIKVQEEGKHQGSFMSYLKLWVPKWLRGGNDD